MGTTESLWVKRACGHKERWGECVPLKMGLLGCRKEDQMLARQRRWWESEMERWGEGKGKQPPPTGTHTSKDKEAHTGQHV